MGRVEKRMYRRARGQALLRRTLLFLTALIITAGLASRAQSGRGLQAQAVVQPTQTPVAPAFDETAETREITLGQETWYAIQTGIFTSQAAAEEKAGLYAQRGAPGYVAQDGAKWRVFIACYGDKDDASGVRERLSAGQDVETYLHSWVCPALTLRLSGMRGQIDVAEAGLSQGLQQAVRLRDGAALLDCGEWTPGEARALAEELRAQAALWLETARSRFARPYPALMAGLMEAAEEWNGRYQLLDRAAQESATALSAEMKLQAMALYDEVCAVRRQLME